MKILKNTVRLSAIVLCLTTMLACNSNAQNNNLTATEFEMGIKKPNVQVLDVRTPEEYQSGHLAHAVLADWNNDSDFKTKANNLDKTKPVYVYCLSGGRSSSASSWLLKNGFTHVYNLNGGIKAWNAEGKGLEVDKIK